VHLVGFIIEKFVTMHVHMNVKEEEEEEAIFIFTSIPDRL
jgi:hypothetical protein